MKNTLKSLILVFTLTYSHQIMAQDAILIQTKTTIEDGIYEYKLSVINKKSLPAFPKLSLYKKGEESDTPFVSSEITADTAPEFTLDTYTINHTEALDLKDFDVYIESINEIYSVKVIPEDLQLKTPLKEDYSYKEVEKIYKQMSKH
ncbi:MAG: hypothetical protein AAFO69_07270 [Bacteroidota bacterium]